MIKSLLLDKTLLKKRWKLKYFTEMILLLNIHYQVRSWRQNLYFYGKQGLLKDNGDLITQYNSEDDKSIMFDDWWEVKLE
jgi:hypothetical protein